MDEAWNILVAAGVPDGAVRPLRGQLGSAASRPDGARVCAALAAVASRLDDLSSRDRELIFAWLRAYVHHWPVAFSAALGRTGADVLEALAHDRFDPNRYLKLRRIAIENLARQSEHPSKAGEPK